MHYTIEEIESVLDTFQWSFPDRTQNRGEVYIDHDKDELVLSVYALDSDNPEDEFVKELLVTVPLSRQQSPEDQIRNLIHLHLCHEADEQMWFGEDRLYYPH